MIMRGCPAPRFLKSISKLDSTTSPWRRTEGTGIHSPHDPRTSHRCAPADDAADFRRSVVLLAGGCAPHHPRGPEAHRQGRVRGGGKNAAPVHRGEWPDAGRARSTLLARTRGAGEKASGRGEP